MILWINTITDEELVLRLLDIPDPDAHAAANRILALIAELSEVQAASDTWHRSYVEENDRWCEALLCIETLTVKVAELEKNG